MPTPFEAPASKMPDYPATWPWRIFTSLLVTFFGWPIWILAMSKNGGELGWYHFFLLVFAPTGWIMIGIKNSALALGTWLMYVMYLLALAGGWTAIFSRPRRGVLWFWRIVSIGLLTPSIILYAQYESLPGAGRVSPGYAGEVWAVGSFLIGLAIWIVPPRLQGEPSDALNVLWSVYKGRPILEGEMPSPNRTFPVIQDDSKSEN